MLPIFNLHNDLLGCVESNEKTLNFSSRSIRAALPQLQEGHVYLDVLPLATLTLPQSAQKGKRQLELYQKLLKEHAHEVSSISNFDLEQKKIYFLLSIENASTLLTEKEPLELLFKRLQDVLSIEKVLYISLTWNQENRFGGGNLSNQGLKEDGKELIRFLNHKNIAIDLSHTSDALAYDLLSLIDQENLEIPVLASHSNAREVCDVKRNLPDELLLEVKKRKGLIGFNFVRHFMGPEPSYAFKHLDHLLKLGCTDQLAFGADFFGGFEAPAHMCSTPAEEDYFFEEYPDSSCFPKFLSALETHFKTTEIKKLAYENALTYLKRHHFTDSKQFLTSHKSSLEG